MSGRMDQIRDKLTSVLQPESLELIDESHKHVGHVGAKSGGGHFNVTIVSAAFEGLNAVKRHQLVYQTLGELMQTEIHALSISAFSLDEI